MRAVSRSHIQSYVLGAPFIVRAQVRAAYARMPHVLTRIVGIQTIISKSQI